MELIGGCEVGVFIIFKYFFIKFVLIFFDIEFFFGCFLLVEGIFMVGDFFFGVFILF